MTATAMARETGEAPAAVARMLERNRQGLAEIARLFHAKPPAHIVTCARGSSDHAASYLKYLSEIVLGLPCCSVGASVVSVYGARLKLRDAVLVTISQSGASPDILAFQAEAKRAGIATIALVNDEASPLAREASLCLPLSAGPETSVAATKSFITAAAMSAALIASCADDAALAAALENLPATLARALAIDWPDAERIIAAATSLYVLGRGPAFPIAAEAALKLKETSAIHAEAYSAAEIRHGPMELVRDNFPILAFAPRDQSRPTTEATLDALQQAGAAVFADLPYAETGHPFLDPVSMITTFYGAAERIARARGRDPDRPRLLAKVTKTR